MKKDEIQESLDKFKEAVVKESKKNLQKQTSTGTLANSLGELLNSPLTKCRGRGFLIGVSIIV